MEHRDDIQFSTLRRVIKALGGSLEIFALFSDARYRLAPGSIDFCADTEGYVDPTESADVELADQRGRSNPSP